MTNKLHNVHQFIYREIGTIMRSLDLCPTESELNDVLTEIEEEDVAGKIFTITGGRAPALSRENLGSIPGQGRLQQHELFTLILAS